MCSPGQAQLSMRSVPDSVAMDWAALLPPDSGAVWFVLPSVQTTYAAPRVSPVQIPETAPAVRRMRSAAVLGRLRFRKPDALPAEALPGPVKCGSYLYGWTPYCLRSQRQLEQLYW